MSKEMPKHGTFCWNELNTKDKDAAGKFYSELLGWETVETDMTGHTYTLLKNAGSDVGGMIQMTEEWGDAPSHWMSYIAVDDVDAAVEKVASLGGKVCVPPTDIPTVGRFTIITDPTGATISLIKLATPEK